MLENEALIYFILILLLNVLHYHVYRNVNDTLHWIRKVFGDCVPIYLRRSATDIADS